MSGLSLTASYPGRRISIQRPTKDVLSSNAGARPSHMSKQPCTPPHWLCPRTITCATFRAVTAYSTAAEVPCWLPSGS